MDDRAMLPSVRDRRRLLVSLRIAVAVGLVLRACSPTAARAPTLSPTSDSTLSVQQIATLSSLEKVDSHPLYTMHFYGSAELSLSEPATGRDLVGTDTSFTWGCALFAALAGTEKTYGRNFDWEASLHCSSSLTRHVAMLQSRWWIWPTWGSAMTWTG